MGVEVTITTAATEPRDIPKVGQTVEVDYTGRLEDGTVFDSSRTRNKRFQFKVGAGEVIKGWDEGILQMAVGEEAIVKCSPEYAYGKKGYPGVIPQNATLIFEVKLHEIKSVNVK